MLIVELLIIRLVPLIRQFRNVDLSIFHSSFRGAIKREINFYLEARTQAGMNDLCARMPHFSQTVNVAGVYFEYTTDKLLAMEYVNGFYRIDRPTDIGADKYWELMQTKLEGYPEHFPVHMFRTLSALWGDMSVYWGWLHGDPHLGNWYFMEPQDGYGWRIFMCDFGMMEEYPPQVLTWILDMHGTWMWRGDTEQWLCMVFRYIEPKMHIAGRLAGQPVAMTSRLLERPCSQAVAREFAELPM